MCNLQNPLQEVRTAKQYTLKDKSYLTKKGKRLQAEGASEEILKKYTKNRYVKNPDSKPLKVFIAAARNGKGRFYTVRRLFGFKRPK